MKKGWAGPMMGEEVGFCSDCFGAARSGYLYSSRLLRFVLGADFSLGWQWEFAFSHKVEDLFAHMLGRIGRRSQFSSLSDSRRAPLCSPASRHPRNHPRRKSEARNRTTIRRLVTTAHADARLSQVT